MQLRRDAMRALFFSEIFLAQFGRQTPERAVTIDAAPRAFDGDGTCVRSMNFNGRAVKPSIFIKRHRYADRLFARSASRAPYFQRLRARDRKMLRHQNVGNHSYLIHLSPEKSLLNRQS